MRALSFSKEGKIEPTVMMFAPTATFVVDRTDDTNVAAAQACTGVANDCSLRGAIIKANATAGADTITVRREHFSLRWRATTTPALLGDLDINDDVTIRVTERQIPL